MEIHAGSVGKFQFNVSYWTGNLFFDVIYAGCFSGVVLLLISSFGNNVNFSSVEDLSAMGLLFISYSIALVPFSYFSALVLSQFVSVTDSETTVRILGMIYNFVTGIILLIVSFVMSLLPQTQELTNTTLVYIFRIFPNFCLADGLLNLSLRSSISQVLNSLKIDIPGDVPQNNELGRFFGASPFDYEVVGYDVVYLLLFSIVYYIAVILFSFGLSLRQSFRLEDLPYGTSLVVRSLTKLFPKESKKSNSHPEESQRGVFGVNDLTFELSEGEVLGLLGENGAGKSTTIRLLTGRHRPDSGIIALADVAASNAMGYCPQENVLMEYLTVREHLYLFLSIKGIALSSNNRQVFVEESVKQFNLGEYGDICATHLSGGNKRKLQVAIALLGNPTISVLDEPSCGMDIENRRFLWDAILALNRAKGKKNSILLTSHSMEECENLCSRVVLLKHGEKIAEGSLDQLKKQIVERIHLTLSSIRYSAETSQKVIEFLRTKLGRDSVIETNTIKKVDVLKSATSLSAVFKALEEAVDLGLINDFVVDESNLEDTFLAIVNNS
eukprot:snap_masked-scaffold_12-processed-gene-10.19-mRNA-1 protein AED:0.43 eAED:0.43 QI:0/1/0.5/1/1/1/2/72/554